MNIYTICPEPLCGMVLFVPSSADAVRCPGCRTPHSAAKLREPFERQLAEGPMLGKTKIPRSLGEYVNDRQ